MQLETTVKLAFLYGSIVICKYRNGELKFEELLKTDFNVENEIPVLCSVQENPLTNTRPISRYHSQLKNKNVLICF